MNVRSLVRRASIAGVAGVMGAVAIFGSAAQAATIPLVNLTIPGPIGGFKLCLDTNCKLVPGIANLQIVENLDAASIVLPAITLGTQPGCTADLDLAITITTPGVSGLLDGYIAFDVTNQNGVPIDHEVIPLNSIPVGLPSVTHTVSFCGALL